MNKTNILSMALVLGGLLMGNANAEDVAPAGQVDPAKPKTTVALNNELQTQGEGAYLKTSVNSNHLRALTLKADHVLVEKTKRRLTLYYGGAVLKQYKISLGRDPIGPKIRAGDNRTPEGFYYIDYRVSNSDYHKALHISYPNEADVRRSQEMGFSPGDSIMLHGLKNDDTEIAYFHGVFDWTRGCIAVTNTEIEEIWKLVPNGTTIEIRP